MNIIVLYNTIPVTMVDSHKSPLGTLAEHVIYYLHSDIEYRRKPTRSDLIISFDVATELFAILQDGLPVDCIDHMRIALGVQDKPMSAMDDSLRDLSDAAIDTKRREEHAELVLRTSFPIETERFNRRYGAGSEEGHPASYFVRKVCPSYPYSAPGWVAAAKYLRVNCT